MAVLYGPEHRALQDEHDSRRLADLWQEMLIHGDLAEDEQAFIASRDFFFLSTVDAEGMPTVSYKGGGAGFVRVLDPRTIAFPGYDGNGMFLSAGNIAQNPSVGLLFIDFETPHRLRVQGEAELVRAGDLVESFPGAAYAIRVAVTDAFVNCGRYIHKMKRLETSRHVPNAEGDQPIAEWKRIDVVRPHLPGQDKRPVESAGELTFDQYAAKAAAGDS
ncbi:pyridoxamine 5'-phosphate oxidase family protein [Chelatococcus sambhunathii]|uniref:Pyridoxamine 5'-phosphate oxidase family protein n=1 Tax=Chelatococcus sambhunathii TaxID=363953 RepID=A0ABU1DH07_9HYPH|nr:pyridoxamine 5'-phosphate oxidase family protein [Chelatococcus sambhunathii]MDR4307403.1 pyridoxamine 5'-phosphate oxidase family protein [Chelatococcus sambhunathii]